MNFATAVSLILSGIGLLSKLVDMMDKDQLINSGKGLAIAQALAEVMKKVTDAKQIEQTIASMSDAAISDELRKYTFDDSKR